MFLHFYNKHYLRRIKKKNWRAYNQHDVKCNRIDEGLNRIKVMLEKPKSIVDILDLSQRKSYIKFHTIIQFTFSCKPFEVLPSSLL